MSTQSHHLQLFHDEYDSLERALSGSQVDNNGEESPLVEHDTSLSSDQVDTMDEKTSHRPSGAESTPASPLSKGIRQRRVIATQEHGLRSATLRVEGRNNKRRGRGFDEWPDPVNEAKREKRPRRESQNEEHSPSQTHVLHHTPTPPTSWLSVGTILLAIALACVGSLFFSLLPDQTHTVSLWTFSLPLSDLTFRLQVLMVVLLLLTVPSTHLLAGRQHHQGWVFWQPFSGGFRFVVLQAAGWTFYGVAVCGLLYLAYFGISNVARLVIASIGLWGLCAQVLVLVSVHYFTNSNVRRNEDLVDSVMFPSQSDERVQLTVPQPHRGSSQSYKTQGSTSAPLLGWRGVGHVGTLLTVLSLIICVMLESQYSNVTPSTSSTQTVWTLLTFIGVGALLVSVPLTHALAGYRLHNLHKPLQQQHYFWFQPFRGGTRYIALQAVGWMLWSVALCIAIYTIVFGTNVSLKKTGFVTSGGVLAVTGQILILFSLRFFDYTLTKTACQRRPIQDDALAWSEVTPLTPSSLAGSPSASATSLLTSHSDIQDVLTHFPFKTPKMQETVAQCMLNVRSFFKPAQLSLTLRSFTDFLLAGFLYHVPVVGSLIVFLPLISILLTGFTSWSTLIIAVLECVYYYTFFSNAHTKGTHSLEWFRNPEFPLWTALNRYFQARVIVPTRAEIADELAFSMSSVKMMMNGSPVDCYGSVPIRRPCPALRRDNDITTTTTTTTSNSNSNSEDGVISNHDNEDNNSNNDNNDHGNNSVTTQMDDNTHNNNVSPNNNNNGMLSPQSDIYDKTDHHKSSHWYDDYNLHFINNNKHIIDMPTPPQSLSLLLSSSPSIVLPSLTAPRIYTFHPHGIYPMTCFWATRNKSFIDVFVPEDESEQSDKQTTNGVVVLPSPNASSNPSTTATLVEPPFSSLLAAHSRKHPLKRLKNTRGSFIDILGASVLAFSPGLREVFLGAGGRDVTKHSILNCLSQGRSCLLIPGGQREMVYADYYDRDFVLYTKHVGFIRLALQAGVPLVPMFSFGENQILDNFKLPTLQQLIYKHTRVFLPMYPHGRFYSFWPNHVPVSVVVDTPLFMPKIDEPDDDTVAYFHNIYYNKVKQLFFKHREAAGYANSKLTFI